ncbi:MAG TPA: nitroreductase family protein [Halothiobacillaceae bacterium]|nr:nitroreductase family protein [Halothiobacillaceae bacterium]
MSDGKSDKQQTRYRSIPLEFQRHSEEEMIARSSAFLALLRTRRSVRHFSDEPVPEAVLRNCIEAAGQAPSGANKQPWTFVVVTDPAIKKRIREAAEKEEREHYSGRASERWLLDLEPLGTDENKPFIETVPALIAVFAQRYGATPEEQHYYVSESIGIATGFLIAALHNAGLATLTHTPSPMKFLSEILQRPANERAYLLLPVGYPAPDCRVPAIGRKSLDEYLVKK